MTWHKTSHHIASNDVTITWPDPATDTKTSKHFTSKHKTSPPWNGRRLVHSKEMIWASRWSVALRTFYRQMLSVLYYIVLFLLETSAPGLSGHYWYTIFIRIVFNASTYNPFDIYIQYIFFLWYLTTSCFFWASQTGCTQHQRTIAGSHAASVSFCHGVIQKWMKWTWKIICVYPNAPCMEYLQ